MAPMFDDFDAALSEAIRGTFAEAALLQARVSTQYVERAPDPAHPAQTVRGVFAGGPASDQIKGQARGAQFVGATRLHSESAEFWIAKADALTLSAPPAKGDRLTLSSRPGSPSYSVSAVQTTDMGDLNLILTAEDPSP